MNRLPRFALLFLLSLFAMAGCSKTKTPVADDKEEAKKPIVVETTRGPVSIVAKFDPPSPSLSDIVNLTITITHEKTLTPAVPELDELFEEFLISNFEEGLPRNDGEKIIVEHRFQLEPLSPGKVTLEAIPYPFTGEGRDEPLIVETKPIDVNITTMLESETPSLVDVGDPVDPMELPTSPFWIATWVVAGLVAASLLFVFIRRRLNRPKIERQLTPAEIAQRDLAALRESGIAQSDPKEFYVRLTGIVRRFVEGATHIRAPEQTTGEFLREIEQQNLFSDEQQDKFRVFLEAADLVKYAAQQPTPEDINTSLHTAEDFIAEPVLVSLLEETEPSPEVPA